MDLTTLSAFEIADKVKAGEVSAEHVFAQFLANTQKINPRLNAFISIHEQGLEIAKKIDQRRQRGETLGRLAGVPVSLKDMFCTKGIPTTAGSNALKNYVPPYSSTVTERLAREDAVLIGKTNQDEFAMGSSGENSAFGVCKNPWNEDFVPGGSSGGAAVSVAAKMSPLAFGTDTGGSIRQPASFCGVVGVKPTYGRVSRHGIIAFASSLDQAGPFSRTVLDSALALEVVSGLCEKDSTTSETEVPVWSKHITTDIRNLRVGKPRQFWDSDLSADVRKSCETAELQLKDAGAKIVDVDLPLVEKSVSIYYLVATAEASSNLARYDGVRFGYRDDFSKEPPADLEDFYSRNRAAMFGGEVKRRILVGTYALSSGYYEAYYKKACQVRRLLTEGFQKAFQTCDVLLGPVTTQPAFKIGAKIRDPLQMYLNDVFTISANLAGLPALSVPTGLSAEGLPLGVQLMAPQFMEQSMFNAAQVIESASKFSRNINGLR
jgi:aspartyl-tRNA(Asn)/glutamyl-tRNA(Gln) amidotransferase subunit A